MRCSRAQIRPVEETNLPNPASVFCEANSSVLEIRQDPDGNQFGAGIFKDGSEYKEWAFYRGECAPGEGKTAPTEPSARPALLEEAAPAGEATLELASGGCLIHRSAKPGCSFQYQAGSSIIQNDEPVKEFELFCEY